MSNTKQSLLEKAKEVKRKYTKAADITPEGIELALAWVMGDVTLTQVVGVMPNKSSSSAYIFLACALREHIKNNAKK